MKSEQRIEAAGPNKIRIFGLCSVTDKEYSVKVGFDDWKDWQSGALVQDAFPYLTADQREYLISGFTPAEWDRTFEDVEDSY